MSSRTARAPERNPVLKKQKKKKQGKAEPLENAKHWLVTQRPPGASELLFIITVIIMTIIVMSHPGLSCSLRTPEPFPSEPALEFRTLHFLLLNSFVAWAVTKEETALVTFIAVKGQGHL